MNTYTHGHHESVLRSHLRRISAAWLSWAAAEDGWFSVLHGQILGRTAAA